MMDRLATSFEKIRQFSTDVSHELRTPLTVIRGQLEVALFTAKTEEQYRDAMVNALEDVERLSQIVRALLLLSQSETGQLVLQKTGLDLAGLTRGLVEEFRISAEEKHIHLTADLPDECIAEADRIQIERLVSNLLSNALKYTPDGGEVRVSLARVPEDGRPAVRLVVEDTGVGIPAEHLPHIFDRFYKVAFVRSGKRPGSGAQLRGLDREGARRHDRRGEPRERRDEIHRAAARWRAGRWSFGRAQRRSRHRIARRVSCCRTKDPGNLRGQRLEPAG